MVAAYNGTLSGDSSPYALAAAVLNAEAALSTTDELAEAVRLFHRLLPWIEIYNTDLTRDIEEFLKRQENQRGE